MKKLVILCAFISISAYAHNHEAHVHGQGTAEISLEMDKLEIDLDIPGDSVVGFETKPKDKKQQEAVATAKATLEDITKVAKIAGGDCIITKHKVEVDYKKNHSEFEVELEYKCSKPAEIKSIEFVAMDHFKGIKQLTINYVSKNKQDQKILKEAERSFVIQ